MKTNGSLTITGRLTRQHIANHLACSREMVTRLLRNCWSKLER